MEWRDSAGKRLRDYPRPSVAVDVAVLTVDPEQGLMVLLHQRDETFATGRWSLPGTFVREHELLRDAVGRALDTKVGVSGRAPQQLHVFDELDRDDRGRVLSVAHLDLVAFDQLDTSRRPGCLLAPIDGTPPRAVLPDDGLAFDHDEIVTRAVRSTRAAYQDRPDPHHLIGDEFTLRELHRLHTAVLGDDVLAKDTFRRHMLPHLVETGRYSDGTVGKPARLFRRANP
ncbi:NUDIX hydrolase [Actinophytocola sp.]|uniref:NUDIX hydrolase n=1 Tax=Actinophytocola sp. TaxID=1872138 RepID=UPI002ED2EFD1